MTFVLLLTVFCTGCKDYPRMVKEGPLFAAPEKAPPSKALVYIYWPWEQQGRRSHLWVSSCEGWSEEILPGGYTAVVVEPGPSCFEAEALSELKYTPAASVGASVGQSLGSVEINAEPGRTFFIRLEQERRLLISGIALRPVKPEIAGPEIRRCRRSIPLTLDELYRQSLEENGR
ncbi:MAG TPA: hypothetical protein VE685_10485 [Thermoanaerobaculia bacterium]|nr:hypothetical protein [Thermoanaerobaculia bacterium]